MLLLFSCDGDADADVDVVVDAVGVDVYQQRVKTEYLWEEWI